MKKKLSPEEWKRRNELKKQLCGTGRPNFPTKEDPVMTSDGRSIEPRHIPKDRQSRGQVLIYNPFKRGYVGQQIKHEYDFDELVGRELRPHARKLAQELVKRGEMTLEEYNQHWRD